METKEPEAMAEIHKIRLKLQEEEKSLSPEDRCQRANQIASDFLKRHSLEKRWVSSSPLVRPA